MKKFRFPLRAVGVVRAHAERRAREALAAAMSAKAAAEGRHAAAERSAAELSAAMNAARLRPVRPMDVVSAQEAYRRERGLAEQMRRQLNTAAAEAERCRQACIEANRQVKVIERLEEVALAAHRAAGFRAEQAEFDEMAGHRSTRKNPLR